MAEAKKKTTTKAVEPKETKVKEVVAIPTEIIAEKPKKETAKAGKRSTKSIEAAEALKAKEERKVSVAEAEQAETTKTPQKPARSKLERRSKGYQKSAALIEKGKVYSLKEALDLATKTSSVKFDASVELHINLNVDPRQADQNVRDNLVLPAGTGKTIKVAVFAEADDAAAAKAAGADITDSEKLLKDLEKGTINFDTLIATPSQMAKLGKYARTLGPRGLMPNPKSGTVTTDVAKAVKEAKAGRVEYRVDSTGIIHLSIGKVSFGGVKLLDNATAVMTSIRGNKPGSVKGTYLKAVHVSTTMGPGITVSTTE